MNNEAIIAIAGIIGTLLAPIIITAINHHYKEKSEKNKRRSQYIEGAKKIGMKLGNAIITLTFYFEEYAKLPDEQKFQRRTDLDGKVLLSGPTSVHQRLISEITELCNELVELSTFVTTYSETRDLYDDIRKNVEDIVNFAILVDTKFRMQNFNEEDVGEVKKEMDRLLKLNAKLQILKL